MADRNIAMEIANALSRADSQSLAAIGFELLESLAEARATIAELRLTEEGRRAGQRQRSRDHRARNVTQRDERDERDTPLVSPFSPTPPITPSDPPQSVSQSSSVWAPAQEAALAKRLPTNAGRIALAAVLARCGEKLSVAAEIGMILDGGRPGVSQKPEHVELALCDYAANGLSDGRFNAIHFRRHVQRAAKPEPEPRIAAKQAVEDVAAVEAFDRALEIVRRYPARDTPADEVQALYADVRIKTALKAIGGLPGIRECKSEKLVWLKRDFVQAYQKQGAT